MNDRLDTAFDQLLLVELKAGQRQAGERLAARWHPRLLRTARRLLRDEGLAQEAVQEAWMGICRGWLRLRHPDRFAAFAYGILVRKCADQIRKTVQLRDQIDPSVDINFVSENADAPSAQIDLDRAFNALPEDMRIAATLYFVAGLTVPEIALAVSVPEGTVKSRLFTARRQLKSTLKGE